MVQLTANILSCDCHVGGHVSVMFYDAAMMIVMLYNILMIFTRMIFMMIMMFLTNRPDHQDQFLLLHHLQQQISVLDLHVSIRHAPEQADGNYCRATTATAATLYLITSTHLH